MYDKYEHQRRIEVAFIYTDLFELKFSPVVAGELYRLLEALSKKQSAKLQLMPANTVE